jgi:hypothetical protein
MNYVSNYKINEHALLIIIIVANQESFEFQSGFCRCFVIDLLMQHEFCCGNLIGRSWRTCKTNQKGYTHTLNIISIIKLCKALHRGAMNVQEYALFNYGHPFGYPTQGSHYQQLFFLRNLKIMVYVGTMCCVAANTCYVGCICEMINSPPTTWNNGM